MINLGGPVAQWIEQRFPKPRVGRSIRLGATSFYVRPGSTPCRQQRLTGLAPESL